MDIYYGRGNASSAKQSEKYIEVNNFGYYKNIDVDIKVERKNGRPDYQLIYIKRGMVKVQTYEKSEIAESGSLIVYRPREKQIYSYIKGTKTEYFWVHFSGMGVEELIRGLNSGIIKIGDAFEFSDAIDKMRGFCIRDDELSMQYASGELIGLTAQLRRRLTRSDSTIERVIELMRQEGNNIQKIADYAKSCGISEYHFIRRFKAYTGMTPHRYRIKIQIDRAASLLSGTTMNVGEVATLLGFDDSLYFSRVFRRETGVSPTEYRLGGKR